MELDLDKIMEQSRKQQLESLVQGDTILLMDAPSWHKSTIKEVVRFNRLEGDRIHWFGPNFEPYSAPLNSIPHIFKMVK